MKKAKVKIIDNIHKTAEGYTTIGWGQCSECGERNGWARPIPDSYKYCPDCGALLDWSDLKEINDEVPCKENNG